MSRTFWHAVLAIVLTLVAIERGRAADVMPVWQNDTVANTLTFNDTFGHQISLGTYSPITGAWMPGGAQSIVVGTSVITGTCPNGEVLTNAAGVVGCASAGSGTVTSVALTLPSFLTISGSPITTSGTLAITATSEPQNEVLASPNGASGVMGPRALVAADISGIPGNLASGSSPISGTCTSGQVLFDNAGVMGCTSGGGTGTVTSVAMSVPSFLTVSGSPITATGTLAVTATSEPQNMFLASPNGSTGAMVPRSIAANDLTSALASPPAIGSNTPSTGGFTTLSASGAVTGVGFSNYLASPPAIGGTAAAAGSFTTLSASSTVSGTGFSTYLASPPAIGGTTAAAGSFTTLSASSTVSGAGVTSLFASPPPIGSTAKSTGAFTTLSSNSIFSNSGGAGYITTVIDNSSDNINGILVSGASTTLAQEITQNPITIKWHPGFTGSPGGTFNTAGLVVITTSTKTDQIYPWGIIGEVINNTDVLTTGNPNAVAVNGTTFTQTVTSSQASSSWGGNFVCDETHAAAISNPTHFCIGAELDVFEPSGSGTDTGTKRLGLFLTAGPSGADTTTHAFAGIDITTNGTLDNGITFYGQGSYTGNVGNLINAGISAAHYTNLLVGVGIVIDNAGNLTDTGGITMGSATGGIEGAGTINIAGAYYDNGTVGVTCATGSPTSSFSAKGGIVTHC